MAERLDETDSTASVAILSNVPSKPSECDEVIRRILESDILIARCWILALFIFQAGL